MPRSISLPAIAAVAGLLASRTAAPRQRCDQPHYRWSVKIDTTLAGGAATPATITDILTRWTPPALGPADRCAVRAGRELNRYVVGGWIRRIEKKKDDGDWHIELTAAATSPPESCIVVEIPLGALGGAFRRARAQLNTLLAGRHIDGEGDLDAPLEVRIAGAAFYDGQHRQTRKHDQSDGGHGRCNTSVRALWELHPVYDVRRP
jgi:hypothetical protein